MVVDVKPGETFPIGMPQILNGINVLAEGWLSRLYGGPQLTRVMFVDDKGNSIDVGIKDGALVLKFLQAAKLP